MVGGHLNCQRERKKEKEKEEEEGEGEGEGEGEEEEVVRRAAEANGGTSSSAKGK